MWFKVRISNGDSTGLLFFFFAMECANICSAGSFPTPFSRVCVVRGFCIIVTYLRLRRCWMFTVRVTRHLNAMGQCFVCTCRGCVHLEVVGIVGDCFVFIELREFDTGLYGCHGNI